MKLTWQRPGAQSFAESPWKWPATVMGVGVFLQIAAPMIGIAFPAVETVAGYVQFWGGVMFVVGLLWLVVRKPGRWSGKYQPAKNAAVPSKPKRQPMTVRQRWYVAVLITLLAGWPALAGALVARLEGSQGGSISEFLILLFVYGLPFAAATFVMGYTIVRLWRMTRTWVILLAFTVPILIVYVYLYMLMSIV